MSARISLREIDDSGIASPAHVYSIDGDLSLLLSYKDKMFPNSPEVKIIGKDQVPLGQTSNRSADPLQNAVRKAHASQNSSYKSTRNGRSGRDISTR